MRVTARPGSGTVVVMPETDPTTPPPTTTPIAERAAAPDVLPEPDPAATGLTWRPLSRADVPALAVLVARVEEADAQPFRTSEVEVEEWFDGDWKDPVADSRVGGDADGALRAWVTTEAPPGWPYGEVLTRPVGPVMPRTAGTDLRR